MQRTGLPWTAAEIEGLKQAWADPFWPRGVIAASLRRSITSVATQASLQGLGDKKRPPPVKRNGQWTPQEIARLRELRDWGTLSLSQIAHELGRSVASCINRASREKMPKKAYVTIPRMKKNQPAPVNGIYETQRMAQARKMLSNGHEMAAVVAALKLTATEAAAIRRNANA